MTDPSRVAAGVAPLPDAPTDAPPGSEEKIAVMARRRRRGRRLHHPADRRLVVRLARWWPVARTPRKPRGRLAEMAEAFRF